MQLELTFILNIDTENEEAIRSLLAAGDADDKARANEMLFAALAEHGSIEADTADDIVVCDV